MASTSGLLASSFLANVLALSAGYKLFKFDEYLAAVSNFSLFRSFNRRLLHLGASTVPAVEIGVAALLLIPGTNDLGLLSATALVGVFLVVVALEARPQIAHCGCWGVASVDVPKWAYLARNLLLVAVAGAATALSVRLGTAVDWSAVEAILGVGIMLPLALLGLELPQIVHLTIFERAAKRGT